MKAKCLKKRIEVLKTLLVSCDNEVENINVHLDQTQVKIDSCRRRLKILKELIKESLIEGEDSEFIKRNL